MIRSVNLGEEVVIRTTNKVGILSDVAMMLANEGVNIEEALGYESGRSACLMLVTDANLKIINELKKKRYKSVKETEVVLVELENKPGALKVVATELARNRIDIRYVYVTSSASGAPSKMVLQTSDNEKTMALLSAYAAEKKEE
jgi:hypothetical protein